MVFRTKRTTHVATSSVRVIEDDIIPNPLINGALYSLIGNRDSLSESIKNEILNGDFRSFENYYYFGSDPERYPQGLPNARYMNSTDGSPAAEAAIASEVGGPVNIEYLFYAPLNNLHLAWQYITEELGYNPNTNELTSLSAEKGEPVYLVNIIPRTIDVDGEGINENATSVFGDSPQRGGTPSRFANRDNPALQEIVYSQPWEVVEEGEEGFTIVYSWVPHPDQTLSFVQEEEQFFSIEDYDNTLEYYHARFTYTDAGATRTAYWTYTPSENRHPDLDGTFAYSYRGPGTYFPFVLIRIDGEDLTKPSEETPEFVGSRDLLKRINIDYETLGEEIHKNPDIEDVNHAALMMAVPADSTDPTDVKYLFEFFKWVATVSRIPQDDSLVRIRQKLLGNGRAPAHAIEFSTGEFRFVLSYEVAESRLVAGHLGPIGTVNTAHEYLPKESDLPGRIHNTLSSRYLFKYQKQITESQYEEIIIQDLVAVYDVLDHYTSYSTRHAEDVLVPINRDIANLLNLVDRSVLYNRSLRLVFHAYTVEKIRWYEQPAFVQFVFVLAIVVMAYFGAYDGLAAAIAEGSLTAIGTELVVLAIQSWAFGEAFSWLVSQVGTDVALVLAAVALVVGVSTKAIGTTDASSMWAERLLMTANGLTQGISDYSEKMLGRYISEMEEFELMAEQKWEELEEVSNLLEPSLLDPFAFIGLTYKAPRAEAPTDFFNRTIHSGNVGTLSFKYIESFVDISLKLPTIGDTLEGTFYA